MTLEEVEEIEQEEKSLPSLSKSNEDETLQVVASLRQKSKDLLGEFDYTPGSAQLWPVGSDISNIFDF